MIKNFNHAHAWTDLTQYRYPASKLQTQNAADRVLSNPHPNTDPRGVRHLPLCTKLIFPLCGTPSLHMCRYRYYSAHKTPQFHLKVVSCWNTLVASKLGSGLCRQQRPGLLLLHITFLSDGEWLQTCFCYTNLSCHHNSQWVSFKKGGDLFLL